MKPEEPCAHLFGRDGSYKAAVVRSREFEKPMSGVHYMNARPALCLSDLNQFLNCLSYRRRVGQSFEVCRIVVDSSLEGESRDPASREDLIQFSSCDDRSPFLFGYLAMLAPFVKKLNVRKPASREISPLKPWPAPG